MGSCCSKKSTQNDVFDPIDSQKQKQAEQADRTQNQGTSAQADSLPVIQGSTGPQQQRPPVLSESLFESEEKQVPSAPATRVSERKEISSDRQEEPNRRTSIGQDPQELLFEEDEILDDSDFLGLNEVTFSVFGDDDAMPGMKLSDAESYAETARLREEKDDLQRRLNLARDENKKLLQKVEGMDDDKRKKARELLELAGENESLKAKIAICIHERDILIKGRPLTNSADQERLAVLTRENEDLRRRLASQGGSGDGLHGAPQEVPEEAVKALERQVAVLEAEKAAAMRRLSIEPLSNPDHTAPEWGDKLAELQRSVIEMEARAVAAEKQVALVDQQLAQERSSRQTLEMGTLEVQQELANLKSLADTRAAALDDAQRTIEALTIRANTHELQSKELAERNAEMAAGWEALNRAVEQSEQAMQAAIARKDELEKLYKDEVILRKKYYNQIEDMKGKIRVYCRTRPVLPKEAGSVVLSFPDEFSVEVPNLKQGGVRQFVFDACFDATSSQDKIFEDTKFLVQSTVDGYNVCIFAYGQTGSGKTHTMTGTEDQPGIAPRAMAELFSILERDAHKSSYAVKCYMIEVYLNDLVDVLLPPKQMDKAPKLEIKKDARGLVYVQNVTLVDVANGQDALATFRRGLEQRHISSTKMNSESSRSHLIFSVIVECQNKQTGVKTAGKLSLVDLAGSERVNKSGATDNVLKEAQAINKSLSALGDVISALSSGESFIPYRNHKLTMLMSDSLGGNAKTLMFVNVSPTDYNLDETVGSLQYAARVKTITNSAMSSIESKEIQRLHAVINQLKSAASRPRTTPAPDQQDDDNGDFS